MREKTNSITHLVKTVAEEVFDEKMKQLRTQDTFYNNLTRVGESWTQFEDDILIREVDSILNRIATKHGRTVGAIRSRINQKEIL
jgi:hypothetical protein